MQGKRRKIEFYDHDLLSAAPETEGTSIKEVVCRYLAGGEGGRRTVGDTAAHLQRAYVSAHGNRITTPTQARKWLRHLYQQRIVDIELVDDAEGTTHGR